MSCLCITVLHKAGRSLVWLSLCEVGLLVEAFDVGQPPNILTDLLLCGPRIIEELCLQNGGVMGGSIQQELLTMFKSWWMNFLQNIRGSWCCVKSLSTLSSAVCLHSLCTPSREASEKYRCDWCGGGLIFFFFFFPGHFHHIPLTTYWALLWKKKIPCQLLWFVFVSILGWLPHCTESLDWGKLGLLCWLCH